MASGPKLNCLLTESETNKLAAFSGLLNPSKSSASSVNSACALDLSSCSELKKALTGYTICCVMDYSSCLALKKAAAVLDWSSCLESKKAAAVLDWSS